MSGSALSSGMSKRRRSPSYSLFFIFYFCFCFLFLGDGDYDEWQCFVKRDEQAEEVVLENVRYIG